MNNFVSITVAKYALTDVIDALRICGIYDITITKEDNNLVIRYKNKHSYKLEASDLLANSNAKILTLEEYKE